MPVVVTVSLSWLAQSIYAFWKKPVFSKDFEKKTLKTR